VPALTAVLGDVDRSVRQHAADALGKIGPAAADAVPALTAAFDSSKEAIALWGSEHVIANYKEPQQVLRGLIEPNSDYRIVLLSGNSGTGKTTLLREFIAFARRVGTATVNTDLSELRCPKRYIA